ncbi:hypothetical protein ACPA9J_33640 [Pseudomonas aeruginosa]
MLPVGDSARYDQVPTHSLTFGVIPERFRAHGEAGPTLAYPVRHGPWRQRRQLLRAVPMPRK